MTTENKPQQNNHTIRVALERAEVLRTHFRDNEDALKLIRALFFGFDISDAEKGTIRSMFHRNDDLKQAVQNKIYSRLSKDAPIGSNPDYWIGTEQQIQGQHPETVKQVLTAKERCLDLLDRAMTLLDDPDAFKVEHIATYSPKLVPNDPLGVECIARNLYVQAIENGLMYIKIIADMSDEDMKEAAKSRKKDSTK